MTHDDHEDHDDPSAIDGRSATPENQQAFQIGHSEGASESITSERCNGKLSSSALVVLQQRIMKPNTWAIWAVVSNHVQVNGAARGVVEYGPSRGSKKGGTGDFRPSELHKSESCRSPAFFCGQEWMYPLVN